MVRSETSVFETTFRQERYIILLIESTLLIRSTRFMNHCSIGLFVLLNKFAFKNLNVSVML